MVVGQQRGRGPQVAYRLPGQLLPVEPQPRIPGSSSVNRPRFSSAGGRVAGSIQSTEVAAFQATKSPMG